MERSEVSPQDDQDHTQQVIWVCIAKLAFPEQPGIMRRSMDFIVTLELQGPGAEASCLAVIEQNHSAREKKFIVPVISSCLMPTHGSIFVKRMLPVPLGNVLELFAVFFWHPREIGGAEKP